MVLNMVDKLSNEDWKVFIVGDFKEFFIVDSGCRL